jgi:hypothetical protein
MAESADRDNGYVACTRCNGEGCELSQVPELTEECSTMHCVMTASVFEYELDDGCVLPVCNEEFPYEWEQMEVAA